MSELKELKAEVAELRKEKEIRDLKSQIDDMKTIRDMKGTTIEYKQAAVRCGMLGVAHFIGGPIASWYYSIKTENYMPSLVGTVIAVVGLPFAVVDLGLTTAVAAPVAAAALHINKTVEKRRELGIHTPDEADKYLVR